MDILQIFFIFIETISVFATKLRMRHVDSSTDTESSPRGRDRSCQLPELYYEEQWIKKRTRRRGNLRKLARQDSRSFSEEEVRLSKSSSKKDHRRRARSESARYDQITFFIYFVNSRLKSLKFLSLETRNYANVEI